MIVHSKTTRFFVEEDINLLTLIADQTAITLQSAERYGSLEILNKAMSALCDVSNVLSGSLGLNVNQVLDQIVQQAVTSVTGAGGAEAILGTLQLYDKEKHELLCVSVYSSAGATDLQPRVGERRPLDSDKAPDGKIGVTGKTVLEEESQLVPDIREVVEYITFNVDTKSELAVPLWENEHVIGVLNVESNELAGFNKNDEVA